MIYFGFIAVLIVALIGTAFIWFILGKLLKIDDLTFRKTINVCLMIAGIGLIFQIITGFILLLKINSTIFQGVIAVCSLMVTITILKRQFKTTVLKSIFFYASTMIFALCLSLSLRIFVVQAYKIPSGSMLNSLLIGDHILVNKFIYKFEKPQKGDIVVYKSPLDKRDFVHRIVAVAGDTIECKEKHLMVNGKPLSEKYVYYSGDDGFTSEMMNKRDNFGPLIIPEHCYFMMGDNRDNAFDSRFWGLLDEKNVKGKVICIYWSWDKIHNQVRWSRMGKYL
jgi:signal peptidase I